MRKSLVTALMANLLAAMAIADPPAAAPATQPAATQPAGVLENLIPRGPLNQLDAQRRSIRTQRQMYESQPVVATYRLEDLVQFSLADGMLRADVACGDLPAGQSRFRVEGSAAIWSARSTTNGISRYVNVSQFDFDQTADGQIWHNYLNVGDTYFTLNATGVGFTTSYHQSAGMVMLMVMKMENGRYRQVLRVDAPTLLRLQTEHPDEVRDYLAPMLRRWTARDLLNPGATDVYTAFDELPAPSDAARKVAALLPSLDSERFTERDQASRDLAKLGRPGVLAALRLDRGILTFEQNDRIDAFVDRERHRLADDPRTLRQDSAFLLDCMEDEDAAVRSAAWRELQKVLGRSIAFDASAELSKRQPAIDAVRAALKQEREAKAAWQGN